MRHVPKRPVPAKERQMYKSWNHTTQPPCAPKSPSDDKNLPEIQFLLQSTGPHWPLQRAGQDSGLLPKIHDVGPCLSVLLIISPSWSQTEGPRFFPLLCLKPQCPPSWPPSVLFPPALPTPTVPSTPTARSSAVWRQRMHLSRCGKLAQSHRQLPGLHSDVLLHFPVKSCATTLLGIYTLFP